MKTYLLLILFSLSPICLFAQTLKGKIVDTAGNSIPGATVYLRELALGIMSDDKGEFQTTLKKGSYTCEFSSLGYERTIVPVVITDQQHVVRVEMKERVYELKEVRISAKGEDPAYAVMRKVIAMAPFYLHQVKMYQSETYVKGTIKIEKIPGFVKIKVSDKDLKNIEKKLFLMESQSEVTYTSPNHYEQKIVAFSNSLPVEMDAKEALSIMTTNLYDPKALGRISPLAPGAFTYYRFSLAGVTTEGEHLINKIKVEPKKKNPKLVSGWLYIIENSWNVKSADLSSTEFGVTIRFTADYNEVKPLVFLPTAYDIDLKIDLMGMKAKGKYYSSVQYNKVEVNETQGVIRNKEVAVPPVTAPKPQSPKQQKKQKQIDALLDKEALSTRESYKLANLMKESVKPKESIKREDRFEIKEDDATIKTTLDSLASLRDSLYWSEVRVLPLRTEEVISYQKKDSLKIETDSLQRKDSIQNRTVGYWMLKLLTGEEIRMKKKYKFGYSGLIRAVPEYNFVDGFWAGQRLWLGMDMAKGKSILIAPSIYYTTARKALNWYIDGDFSYASKRSGKLSISGGNTTADFAGKDGSLRIINSFASLLFAEDPIRFYQKKFVEAENQIDLANGLQLTTGMSYAKRNALNNHTSYSFWGNRPASNLPSGQITPMPDNTAFKANIQIEYTPNYYYHLYQDRKRYRHSKYPTISLRYEKGIPTGQEPSASFDMLEVGIRQKVELNAFDHITYQVNAGKFLSSKHIYLPDYKHFKTNELFVSGYVLNNSFSLLDNYAYSTDRQWLQAHFTYTSNYLLLKRLPFLQSYLFNEALHARTLWIPQKNYTEFGYSIGFENIARVGVFVGLDKGKYDATGFTISIPLLKLLEHK